MPSRSRSTLCLSCLLFLVNGTNGFSDEEKLTVVERKVSIASRSATDFTSIDIGELQAGADVTVRLSVGNLTSEPFKIKKITLGCSCMSGKAFGDVIEPGKEVIVEIKMKVPTKAQKESMTQPVRIDESDSSRFQFGFVFRFRGIACFRVDSVGHNLGHDSSRCEFKVPLLYTSPLEIGDIVLKGTGDLSVLSIRVVSDGNGQFAICTATVENTGELAWAGELIVQDKKSGISNAIPCFVGRESPVVILPGLIRFKASEKSWVANAIIRDNRIADTPGVGGKTKVNDEISIGCATDNGVAIKVESNKVSASVYRVKLEINKAEVQSKSEKLPSNLRWQFGWNEGISEQTTRVVGL
ncbi:MAG: DUF1573 domain-containing protein [Pirellula sp.]|nr:DUF1573 domain-containing protein [Pirellula sp.]